MWTCVFGGFALLFLVLLTVVRRAVASLSRLASILEATTDFVAIADHRGRPIYLNRAGRRMLGIRQDEPIGRIDLLDRRPDWVRSQLLSEGFSSAREAGVWSGETALIAPDGDEFAVVLPAANAVDASFTAEKLLRALEAPFTVEGYTLEAASSIGIAVFPEHGDDPQILMRHADVAMYIAKRGQRGHAVYRSEQDEYSPGRLTLVGELRRAIDQGELTLHYQPQIDCRTSHVTRLEVLVRWQHAERGLVPPDEFVPLAEDSGLIEPLTRWVLKSALEQCQAWRFAGLDLPVAVNLSMRNLHDPSLPALVSSLLERYGVPAGRLWLEITESALMADASRAMAVLEDLRRLGVQISIDDFGTGYSSLAYLKQLPVDELKIDKSFVFDMTSEENDAAIVRAIVELGHQLGLRVVAEGVENEDEWKLLRRVGCDMAQGFYFARPFPAPELARWLADAYVDGTNVISVPSRAVSVV